MWPLEEKKKKYNKCFKKYHKKKNKRGLQYINWKDTVCLRKYWFRMDNIEIYLQISKLLNTCLQCHTMYKTVEQYLQMFQWEKQNIKKNNKVDIQGVRENCSHGYCLRNLLNVANREQTLIIHYLPWRLITEIFLVHSVTSCRRLHQFCIFWYSSLPFFLS